MQKYITKEIIETEVPVVSNTREMRAFLLEQMVLVARGQLEPQQVTAVARIAQQVYNFSKLEIQAAKYLAQNKSAEVKTIDF
jgi:hypothetical protein